ncbi:hypothetical protein GCM10023232_11520 [Sphingosinicella ginsenosidimutans]|uniref:Circumsporozoite protein n=1 Tax=Allosphingosinicella ginsenosidimutans TaxID=1176539 RepID=A0A5C6TNR2_9SPHN|nr:hypothetical protein [Sphingosinicella ginsenosidimutans]TXC62262.1 hypothetical protein FRZ32_00495 [Sphingosinicella ginsenosidimutans]
MRFISTLRVSMVAASALFVAACGGHGGEAANNTASDLDSNLMIDQAGNDSSAMESVANAPAPAPIVNDTTMSNEAATDTGAGTAAGDTVDSNVAGM